MSTLAAARLPLFAFRSGGVAGFGVADLVTRLRRAAQAARAARRLREMDDRMLADIGLSRAEIDRATGAARLWARL